MHRHCQATRYLSILLFVMLFSACSGRKNTQVSFPSSDPDIAGNVSDRPATIPPFTVQITDHNASAKLKRVHLPLITMSDWTEGAMLLDTAVQLVEKDGNLRCEFVDPLVSDESTEIFPFQSYWVVFNAENFPGGVDHLPSFSKIYFGDDLISPAMFVRKDGKVAAEFRYASSLEHTFVKIYDVKVAEDRASVRARFSEPISVHALLKTTARQGTCDVTTFFCRDKDRCDNENTYHKLDFIHVIQGFLGVPEDVVLGEVK